MLTGTPPLQRVLEEPRRCAYQRFALSPHECVYVCVRRSICASYRNPVGTAPLQDCRCSRHARVWEEGWEAKQMYMCMYMYMSNIHAHVDVGMNLPVTIVARDVRAGVRMRSSWGAHAARKLATVSRRRHGACIALAPQGALRGPRYGQWQRNSRDHRRPCQAARGGRALARRVLRPVGGDAGRRRRMVATATGRCGVVRSALGGPARRTGEFGHRLGLLRAVVCRKDWWQSSVGPAPKKFGSASTRGGAWRPKRGGRAPGTWPGSASELGDRGARHQLTQRSRTTRSGAGRSRPGPVRACLLRTLSFGSPP